MLDTISNKFVEGCSILSWAEQAGMKTTQWEEVFFARWVGDLTFRASQFTTKALQGSIKRSNSAFGSRYHPVFVYPNLQRSAAVTVSPILDLLSKGNYDIDPMSIIATSYAIGTVNMAYIIDQFAKIGQSPPSFCWKVGLHTDLYEEQRHLEIEVNLPSVFIADMFELELQGLDFLSNDGGVATQLRELIEPGGVMALIGHSMAIEDDTALPGTIDISPMMSAPVAAPLGASFLVMAPQQRVAGTITTDKMGSSKVERILEISPNSSKLCAMACIQEHEISSHAVNARLLGDEEAATNEDLADECARIAGRTVDMISANVPTEHPLYQAAMALRSCGLVSVRWDDVTNLSKGAFESEVRRVIMSNPQEALSCLHSYGRDILLSVSGAYESRPLRVKASRDPDKSNKTARVAAITSKFKARAKEYEQRIRALREGYSTLQRDIKAKNQDRKKVYLVAARNFMQCAEFTEGPELDIGTTMERVLSRINAKIESLGGKPTITDHNSLISYGRVNASAVEAANYFPSSKGWYPDEYARGVLAAERWAHEDCSHETQLIYYTPRSVEVKIRVKKHMATVVQHTHERTYVPKAKEEEELPPPIEVEASSSKPPPSEAPAGSIASLAAFFKKSRKSPDDYAQFVDTLDIWQMVLLHMHAGEDYPIKGKRDDRIRLTMQGTSLKRGDIGEKATIALTNSTKIVMARHQMAQIAPVAEDLEKGEDLIE
jgi:hypothetical protein